jgi:hypothetical protein
MFQPYQEKFKPKKSTGGFIMRKFTIITTVLLLLAALFIFGFQSTVLAQDPQPELTGIELLGKAMFFDRPVGERPNLVQPVTLLKWASPVGYRSMPLVLSTAPSQPLRK